MLKKLRPDPIWRLACAAAVAALLMFPYAAHARAAQGTQAQETNRYAVAGFDSAEQAENFFRELQRAVAADDRARVASMIDYPIKVRVGRAKVSLRRKADLLRRYDSVFTRNVKAVLAKQEAAQLFFNYQGAMVGDGQIWFAPRAGRTRRVRVIAINN